METIEEGHFLRVSDLKQFAYCERIVYYLYCLPDVRPVTYKMEAAREAHEREENREERRSLRPYGLQAGERVCNLWLESSRLGLRGRLDLAIRCRDEAIPVEYKDSPGRLGPHWVLQLAAYGLLLQEAWGLPVRRGFIYYIPQRRAREVSLTPALLDEVEEKIRAIWRIVLHESMPPPTRQRARCVTCEFRLFCNDVPVQRGALTDAFHPP